MNLSAMLARREAEGRPIRVGLIGAGKFGTMFLAQARHTAGLRVGAICDLSLERARLACDRAGYPEEQTAVRHGAGGVSDAMRHGKIALVESSADLIASEVDVVVEATGIEEPGARHAFGAISHGKHVVMVNVETDVVVGPVLRRLAEQAGVVYSLAYGDQPALICELCDWARTCGFRIVAAGKGTRWHPDFRRGTPEDSLERMGFTPEQIAVGGFNPKMFNSFLDGTKQAIEMAAVANAYGLRPDVPGMHYVACSARDLPNNFKPKADGGILDHEGIVDITPADDLDHRPIPGHLKQGVWLVFTSDNAYSIRCFTEYNLITDATGKYAALYRPSHLIGLELGVTIASAVLRGEPTGAPVAGPCAEVTAVTRQALAVGTTLDGEGGYCCYGSLLTAADARRAGCVPMGMTHGLTLKRAVPQDHTITWADVELDPRSLLYGLRTMQDALFPLPAPQPAPAIT